MAGWGLRSWLEWLELKRVLSGMGGVRVVT